jgi:hypothetical protein
MNMKSPTQISSVSKGSLKLVIEDKALVCTCHPCDVPLRCGMEEGCAEKLDGKVWYIILLNGDKRP